MTRRSPRYTDDPKVEAEQAKWTHYAASIIESNGYKIRWPGTKTSRWDFEIQGARGRPWMTTEVKRRHGNWQARDTVFLDVAKAKTMLVVSACGWFVVIYDDLLCRFTWLTPQRIDSYAIDRRPVQKARLDHMDERDRKLLIPAVNFHTLYDLR